MARLNVLNAAINVKPQGPGGGARAEPGEFDIFMEARSQISLPPGTYWKSISRPWGNFFY